MGSSHRRGAAPVAAVVTTLVTALVPLGTAPARAGGVFVQVTPSTVPAGHLIGVRAGCRDNIQPATLESRALGRVTVNPQDGFLSAVVPVPDHIRPGSYRIELHCPKSGSASTMLYVVHGGRPHHGPATGFGGGTGGDPADWFVTAGVAATVVGLVLGLVTLRRNGEVRRRMPGGTT